MKTLLITGGAGFIGSALVWKLNQLGEEEILIVDELGKEEKWKNLTGLKFIDLYHPNEFIELVLGDAVPFEIETILHMGACSSTTEKDADFLLCDDKKAKKFARSFGINVIGSLGILLKAKEAKLIDELSPLIGILRYSSIFIDDKTYELVLKMAKEI